LRLSLLIVVEAIDSADITTPAHNSHAVHDIDDTNAPSGTKRKRPAYEDDCESGLESMDSSCERSGGEEEEEGKYCDEGEHEKEGTHNRPSAANQPSASNRPPAANRPLASATSSLSNGNKIRDRVNAASRRRNARVAQNNIKLPAFTPGEPYLCPIRHLLDRDVVCRWEKLGPPNGVKKQEDQFYKTAMNTLVRTHCNFLMPVGWVRFHNPVWLRVVVITFFVTLPR